MPLAKEVHDAGQEVASATGSTSADILNRVLARFLGWPFIATSGYAVDADGKRTQSFASIIHTKTTSVATTEADVISSDAVAAAIDFYETIDLEKLRAAHWRIAEAKTLKKAAVPCVEGSIPITTVALGIIFAQRSAIPLEELAEELNRLNRQTPSQQWPDMIVVASAGVINYMAQFPGEPLKGDFLPPAEGALGPVDHVEHRSRQDSERCKGGIYFKGTHQMSLSPVE